MTEANELMRPRHNRMPVILDPDDYDAWMDPDASELFKLRPILTPLASAKMKFHPVSTTVNSLRNDSPNLIG